MYCKHCKMNSKQQKPEEQYSNSLNTSPRLNTRINVQETVSL